MAARVARIRGHQSHELQAEQDLEKVQKLIKDALNCDNCECGLEESPLFQCKFKLIKDCPHSERILCEVCGKAAHRSKSVNHKFDIKASHIVEIKGNVTNEDVKHYNDGKQSALQIEKIKTGESKHQLTKHGNLQSAFVVYYNYSKFQSTIKQSAAYTPTTGSAEFVGPAYYALIACFVDIVKYNNDTKKLQLELTRIEKGQDIARIMVSHLPVMVGSIAGGRGWMILYWLFCKYILKNKHPFNQKLLIIKLLITTLFRFLFIWLLTKMSNKLIIKVLGTTSQNKKMEETKQKAIHNFHFETKDLNNTEIFNEKVINRRYKHLSRIFHPDVKGGSKEKFQQLTKDLAFLTALAKTRKIKISPLNHQISKPRKV